jgi:hypothetical protein
MIKSKSKNIKHIDFKCYCGCGDTCRVYNFGDYQAEINTKHPKEKWSGVVLGKKDIEKLIKFLSKI